MRSTPVTPLSRRAFGLGALGVAGAVLAGCTDNTVAPIPTASVPSLIGVSPTGSTSASPSGAATPSGSVSGSPTPSRKPPTEISSLDVIKVTGAFGSAPTIVAPYPFKVAKTLNKVLIAGDGPVVKEDASLLVHYSGINAAVGGAPFDSSYTRGNPTSFPLADVVTGFRESLKGKRVGDRVLIVMTGPDGYDSQGGNETAGILKGDCLMFVVDIIFTTLSEPWGTAVTPTPNPSAGINPANLPTVSDNGAKKAPTITIPAGATKPTKLTVQTLIEGKGPALAATDALTANYVSVNWDTKEVLAEDYTTGPETANVSALVEAWQNGLVGRKGGSRVLIIAPPDTAYPKGNATPSIPAEATQIYVVDLLYMEPAGQQ